MQLQASYYVRHPVHGPLCFLCDSTDSAGVGMHGGAAAPGSIVTITPRDSIRRKVFFEPFGIMTEVAAGVLVNAQIDDNARTVTLVLSAADGLSSRFRVLVSTPSLHRVGKREGVHLVTSGATKVRNGYEFPLTTTKITFAVGKAKNTRSVVAVTAPNRNRTIGNSNRATVNGNTNTNARPTTRPTTSTRGTAFVSESGNNCTAKYNLPVPDAGHPGMQLKGSPDLAGFEGGVASTSTSACADLCRAQKDASGGPLACQSWTFAAQGRHNNKPGSSGWCWLRAGRGNAVGMCGYVSAYCDNRPSPPSEWPCCSGGWSCPNPINITTPQ